MPCPAAGGKPEANKPDLNGGRLELRPLVPSPDSELEVSSSRPRVSLPFTVERGHGAVSNTFLGGTLAEGPRILIKKSAGQDKCSGGLIFVLMTPTLGP